MRRTIVLSVLALAGCSTEVRGSASPADVVAPPTGDATTEDDGSGDDGSGDDDSGDDDSGDDATDDGTEDAGSGPASFGGTHARGLRRLRRHRRQRHRRGLRPDRAVPHPQSGTTEEAQVFDTANGPYGTP
ncbi:hypothetical protein [Geodermatophilus normandii]|uniref:Uncharacterized protein n=1 Tax=Geodermatophilus normandii TaxID=1137989 RepID=A0A6P0GMH5_9ACTN|nr:hypothetical protein [Geodermatophilus normandii]NEM08464.1 hypothetical protein [Geodermatophilus normandii]